MDDQENCSRTRRGGLKAALLALQSIMALTRRQLLAASAALSLGHRLQATEHPFVQKIRKAWIIEPDEFDFNRPTQFVLQHGRIYTKAIAAPVSGIHMGERRYFRDLALRSGGELTYMEGFAEFMGRPELHVAFCMSKDGTVITESSLAGAVHFGVGFQPWIVRTGTASCSLLDSGAGLAASIGELPARRVLA